MMTPRELAEAAVRVLADKKAADLKLLKTEKLTVLADYFLICTATSTTHIKTLSDELGKAITALGEPTPREEGFRAGGWVLMDFGCLIVHLFLRETRSFYDLERLWSDAEDIDVSGLITQ